MGEYYDLILRSLYNILAFMYLPTQGGTTCSCTCMGKCKQRAK